MDQDDSVAVSRKMWPSGPKPVIVGIGASAGGVQALQTLFDALPDAPGAAFVVVVHLDPQSHSELSSILGARTRMPVVQVEASEKLQANHVYVIAPGRRLHISDEEISAAHFDEPRGQRAPIDLFFRSLAEQYGDGFAVILTGAGSDGTIGVRAVKEAGGIILVQDPNEADYPSMPRNAIATGIADFVLPVRELAARLAEMLRNKESIPDIDERSFDDELVVRILAIVRVRTGHDFTRYKRSTVLRRIARRMQITRTDELKQYSDYLRDHAEEASALLGDLLISVTTFFRDSEAFDSLRVQAIPRLFDSRDATDTVRVWIAGCATGEEAYTIAIMLLEEAAKRDIRPYIQVFGSDLDSRALAIAREGVYPATIEADVNEERLRKFFTREGDQYRVRRELRDIVVFAVHDLLKDPPFSRIDLITCRNVLIYLNRELQQQIINTFHYALNANGFLLLGSAETADNQAELFRVVDRKARIFQSTALAENKPRALPRLIRNIALPEQRGQPPGVRLSPRATLSEAVLHLQALEEAAPPNILVDPTHRVMHLSQNAGRYLQPPGGPLSGDIVELARPELRLELRSALHRAFENRLSTLTLPILVQFNGAPHRVHLQVRPITDGGEPPRSAVVMFIEGELVEQPPDGELSPNDETMRQLREELQLTQERLRTTLEESESATEELRAANEELQSINEEYRSTSEELETSKEELQSINEELQTVNTELKSNLDAVSRAHSDLQNLMAATDFATLFLDTSLRIKRFTEPVTELFRLTPGDLGRPVMDFAHKLHYDDLVTDAQAVIARLAPLRREVRSHTGRWFDVNLRPYRTVDDRIDGVVISFIDATEHRQAEEALRESERQLQQLKRLVDLSREAISVRELDGGIIEWNRGCEELYGYTRAEAVGRNTAELLQSAGMSLSLSEVRTKLVTEGSWSGEFINRTKDGRSVSVESRLQLESFGGRRLVLSSARDITERKSWEERQRLLLGELTRRVKYTLAVVQSIAHQTLDGSHSSEDFVERFDGRILALAAAHSLFVESNWEGVDFAALVRNQLLPNAEENRLTIDGEPVSLPAELAASFGLVLHELATNAAKHGSLSHPDGTVKVSWTLVHRDKLRLLRVVWREKGPPARPPAEAGFGSQLIENAIPGATVSRVFRPEGFLCTIELPLGEAQEHGASLQP